MNAQDYEAIKAQLPEALLVWFDGSKRTLPWRSTPAPYRVWVSEIMLQQTRVEAVKPYFERFMEALPDIPALAACEEDRLLKLWEGLGYYNRVRNMQKAAKLLVENGQCTLPDSYEELCKLPGIGSYTAGAIASIAFGKTAPAVDGNVLRVLSRVFLEEGDVLSQKVKREMETLVLSMMPGERPGDFNQALMELGAMVCVPNGSPKCEACPLKTFCGAHLQGRTAEFPVKAKKKERRIEKKTIFVLLWGGKVGLRKREEKGLLAGLYEFPNVSGHLSQKAALGWVEQQGFEPLRMEPLEEAKHIFSHVEWHMKAYAVQLAGWPGPTGEAGCFFIEPEETREAYPIPAAFLAYTRYMNMELGYEQVRKEIRDV